MIKQDQKLFIDGSAGKLEAILSIPDSTSNKFKNDVVVICHPHPLYEGSMHNKVVTSIAKTFFRASIPSIRFNYRGVGNSDGSYDNAVGEIDDCLAVIEYAKQRFNTPRLWLAGFSFGAYIAARASEQVCPYQLITVAPAIDSHPEYLKLKLVSPLLVIQGQADEVVSVNAVYDWYNNLAGDKSLVKIPEASHFFHGKLLDLQKSINGHFGF